MDDVTAVKWLPLQQAVDTLTRPHEKAFLISVGQAALQAAEPLAREATAQPAALPVTLQIRVFSSLTVSPDDSGMSKPNTFFEAIRAWFRRWGA